MKNILALFGILLALHTNAYAQKIGMNRLLEPEQTDSINIMELPRLGLAMPLGGDSVMIIDNECPVIHVSALANAHRDFVATDSAFYFSEGNFIYAISPDGKSHEQVAVLDNEQFTMYPAVGSSFFVVTADDDYSCCQLFDPINHVYSDVLQINGPIYKVAANENHLIVWAGDHLLLVGEKGKAVPLLTEPTLRDFVLTPKGIVVAADEGIYLYKSLKEQIRIAPVCATRLWYVADILYILSDSGALVALYEEE